jgi:putative sterol carrier protein
LNTSDYFRQKYGEDCFTLLLVATDDKHAAFLTVKDGHVEVEDVKNEPAELRKVKSNGKIMTSEEVFFSFAMGKVNPVKAILTGKLRIRGYRTVLRFTKYFSVLAYLIKHSNPST